MDAEKDAAADEQQDLSAENRHLKETIVALREALERQEIEKDDRVQQALASANDEIAQLKATIQAVRDKMEEQQLKYAGELQAAKKAARDELLQLKETIQLLRDRLEERNAG